MNLPPEFEPLREPEPSRWPGPLALIGLAVIVLAISMCSCGSKFYGPDGKPTAMIHGDYTYQRTAKGDVSISLRHSETIRAQGNAVSKTIGATGTAAGALILATP